MATPTVFTSNQLTYLVHKLQRAGKPIGEIARLLECTPASLEGYEKGHLVMGKAFQMRCLKLLNANFKRGREPPNIQ